MNLPFRAEAAYSSNKTIIATHRGSEYQAFARATHQLSKAIESDGFIELVVALEENRKLWSVLANDVLKEGNALPRQLRAQIFYLSEFTRQQSLKLLGKAADADAEALVDINKAVMRGLRGISEPDG
jgi:flagellar biosynthesis activator protein FlaF